MNATFAVFVLLLPFIMVAFIIWGVDKKRRETVRAQPVVQTTTCSNVIYTIPTNDPNRFSTNISTTLRHHYDLPPSYDQVVIQTVQTPATPPATMPATQPITTPSVLPDRPPNYAEVPK